MGRTSVIARFDIERGYPIMAEAILTDDELIVLIQTVDGVRARQSIPITSVKASSLLAAAEIIAARSARGQQYEDDSENASAWRIVALAKEIEKESKTK